MQATKKKKLHDLKDLKSRDKAIQKLAKAEKVLLDQLHHTIKTESHVIHDIRTMKD